MNNYQNPYFMGAGQVPPYSYPYSPYQSNMAQQPLNTNNQTFKQMNYDFQGNYVKSYEEAKNAPYTDKTMVYLDTENDKIYIKRINEKGTPETNVYLITSPIDETSTKENKKMENSFKQELDEMRKNYDSRIANLEQQIQQIIPIEGGN